MKLITSMLRVAHVPPWAHITDHEGIHGYFTDTNAGHKLFLNEKNNRIHLPKALRGRAVEDLQPEDFASIPPDDAGDKHYSDWRENHEKEQKVNKLHNGYEFEDEGRMLIERFMKFVQKYNLENVETYGLDSKYNVNAKLFEKMLGANNRDDVKRAGRSLAKQIRTIILLLAKQGNKKANRIEGDFFLQYTKLEPLFDFDPQKYKPDLKDSDPQEAKAPGDGLMDVMLKMREEVQPLLNPQMTKFIDVFNMFLTAVEKKDMEKAKEMFANMQAALLTYLEAAPNHEIGQAAERIFTLPIMVDVFEALGLSLTNT